VIVDGELVALDDDGLPSFSRLQRRLVTHKPNPMHQRTIPSRLWLFDILHLDGQDLTTLPYRQRREILQQLLPGRAGTVAVAPDRSQVENWSCTLRQCPWRQRALQGPVRRAEIVQLTEAVKAQAIELAIVRGKSGWA
jgi:hypothetical protein